MKTKKQLQSVTTESTRLIQESAQGQHTPTPWYAKGFAIFSKECDELATLNCGYHEKGIGQGMYQEANAAFIVRAVNAHEELLGELISLVAWVEEDPERAESLARQLNNARAAIAKAEVSR